MKLSGKSGKNAIWPFGQLIWSKGCLPRQTGAIDLPVTAPGKGHCLCLWLRSRFCKASPHGDLSRVSQFRELFAA